MFEPCVRLDESRSRDTGGAGLGLAIARTIIRGHGGDIRLENRAEGGLRATVVLPESGGGRSRDGRGVCDRPRFHWPRVTDARTVPGNGLQLNPHGTDSRRACIAALPSQLSSRTTSVLSGVSAPTASVARAQVRLALPPAAAPRPTVPAAQVSLPRVTPPAHRFDGDGHAGRACSHHAVLTRLCDRQHRRHRAEASGDTARRAMMPPAAVQSAPEHGVFDKHGRALGKTRMYALVTRRDSLEHRPILQGIIGFPRESSPPDPRSRRLGCFLASTPGNSPPVEASAQCNTSWPCRSSAARANRRKSRGLFIPVRPTAIRAFTYALRRYSSHTRRTADAGVRGGCERPRPPAQGRDSCRSVFPAA